MSRKKDSVSPTSKVAEKKTNNVVISTVGIGNRANPWSNPYLKGPEMNPYSALITGNYWQQTGMPWVSSEGRKAVLTEWFWQPIRGQPRSVDTNELRTFAQSFWIHSCVRKLIELVSTLEWDIVPKDEFQEMSNDPVVKDEIKRIKEFLNHPNRNEESWADVVKAWLKDVFELDAGVLVKVYSRDSYDFNALEPKSGAPLLLPFGRRHLTEIYARDGSSFLKEADKFGFVKGYWQYSYQIPAHPVWFNRDEIVYISQHPRAMSVYGFSVPQSILDLVKSLHYSVLYNRSYFEQGAIPPGVVALEDTSEEEMIRLKEFWMNELQGKPWQMPFINKKAQFIPFVLNNNELQFLETQTWYYKLVISSFGLTPDEMGLTDTSNRSVGVSQAEVVRRGGVRPVIKLLEYAINNQILPEIGGFFTEYKYIERDMTEEKQKREMEEMDLRNNVLTINEVRRDRGLDPVAWGDGAGNQTMVSGMGMPMPPGQEGTPFKPNEQESNRKKEEEAEVTRETLKLPHTDTINGNHYTGGSNGGSSFQQVSEGKNLHITEVGGDPRTNPLMGIKSVLKCLNCSHINAIDSDKCEKCADAYFQLFDAYPEAFPLKKNLKKCVNCDWETDSLSTTRCEKCTGMAFKNLPVQPVAEYYNDPKIQYGVNPISPKNPMATQLPKPLQNAHPEETPVIAVVDKPRDLIYPFKDIEGRCPICGFDTLTRETIDGTNGTPNQAEEFYCTRCRHRFPVNEVMQTGDASLTQLGQREQMMPPAPAGTPVAQNFYGQDKASPADWSPKAADFYDIEKNAHYMEEFSKSPDMQTLIDWQGWDATPFNEKILENLLTEKFKLITGITKQDKDKVRKALLQFFKEKWNLDTLEEKLTKILKDPIKAKMIARTETLRVSNKAKIENAKETGSTKVKWKARGNVQKGEGHECWNMDGKEISIDDQVVKNFPPHPMCRCVLQPLPSGQ